MGKRAVIGGNEAAFAGYEKLGRRKGEYLSVPELADWPTAALAGEGMGRVEDQLELVA
jgi:hypothetical protein